MRRVQRAGVDAFAIHVAEARLLSAVARYARTPRQASPQCHACAFDRRACCRDAAFHFIHAVQTRYPRRLFLPAVYRHYAITSMTLPRRCRYITVLRPLLIC